jgi:fructose-bisphosphate aldolase class II
MITPILLAGQKTQSPLLVQISSREMARYGTAAPEVAEEFYKQVRDLNITVPVGLHLDHTKDLDGIKVAIAAGFTSVMIDASEHSLDENIRITREVVDYAHAHNVAVEAE